MPAEQRKQNILDAARRAFSRRGDVAGTTIRDIAAEAGGSEGVIYRPLESKEGLFFEGAVRPLHGAFALGGGEMAVLVPQLPRAERHKLAVAYYREMILMLADLIPLLGLVLFGDPHHADPFYREHLLPALDELGDQWAEAYRRISGKAQPTSRTATLVHFGVALMFALDQRRSANPPDVDAIAEELAREGYVPMAREATPPKRRRRSS